MENGSESPKPDVAADVPAAQSQDSSSDRMDQKPLTEPERLTQEVIRLNRVIDDLKTRVDELEQDKRFLMGQLKGQLQLQNMLATSLTDDRPEPETATKKESPKKAPVSKARSTPAAPPETDKKKELQQREKESESIQRLHDPNFASKLYVSPSQITRSKPPTLQKKVKHFTKLYLARVALVLSILGIGLTFILLNPFGNTEADAIPRSAELESNEHGLALNTVSALKYESSLYVDEPSQSLPVRFSNVQKRIRIADQLLQHKEDQDAQRFGVQLKLQALIRRSLLNNQLQVPNNRNRVLFADTAKSYLNADDSVIASSAKSAASLHAVLDLLEKYDPNNSDSLDDTERADIVAKFANALEISTGDVSTAQLFFEVANLFNDGSTYSIPEFLLLCHDHYVNSKTEFVRTMASEANHRYLNLQHPLTPVITSVESQVDDRIAELGSQIESILDLPNIPVGQFERITKSISGVIQTGRIDEARELLAQVLEKVGTGSELQHVRNELVKMKSHTDSLGKPFSLVAFSQIDGTPVELNPDDAAQMVLFVSSSNYQVSIERLNRLGETIEMFQSGSEYRVSIAVVFKDDELQPEMLQTLEVLKNSRERLGVWKFAVNSPEGRNFLERFPISRVPFLVMVNGEGELVAIDPPVHFVESIVFKMVHGDEG